MRSLLLCLTFFVMLSVSCRQRECDDGSLSPEEWSWIFYDENQRIVFFSSATQQYDTGYAGAVTANWAAGSSYDPDCAPNGTQSASQNLALSSRTISFSVAHDYDRTPTGARINDREIPVASAGSITINGHGYTDVRIIQLDSALCVDLYIWRYYVNKEFGLLRFDQKNGPTWELQR